MPHTVHLQYNSPMGLYSKEAAVEQFQQQIGENPPPDLPAADKHFDPTRSATLKYLKEAENENFGENFFEKVAYAEAPNVPQQSEPHWARMAREKSERARSRTPADPLHGSSSSYRPASSPAPSNHPIHLETAREHADKNRIFTHNINEPYGRPYYEAAYGLQKHRRSHSAGRELNRGYELGGIDYTNGIHIDHGTDYQYYEEPARKPQPTTKLPPGYELGGTDFYKGHVSSGGGNYRGHGPDPPRLRSKYSADPHDPCNVAVAPNIEGVDANLLVGDTLSNQKIRHEVRSVDPNKFGTSFGPPQGFSNAHNASRPRHESPKPVVYSLSANKSLARSQSVPRSSAPPEQRDVFWSNQQHENDKEISIRTLLNDEALRVAKRETSPYWADRSQQKHEAWQGKADPQLQRYETYITEPNWRRNVDQRRLAWERRAFETEQRLSRPFSEKVAPGVPPAWHSEAQYKHQQWQQQADNMNGNNYQTFNTSSSSYHPQQDESQFNHSAGSFSGGAIPQNLLNTGYNTNQVDYVLSHKDRYNEGPHYQPPIVNSNQYSSSSYSNRSINNSISNQAIPLGAPQHNSSSYTTETRSYGNPPGNQNYHSSSYNLSSSANTRPIPVQQNASNYQEFDVRSEKSYSTFGALPLAIPAPLNENEKSDFNRSFNKTTTTTTTTTTQPPTNNFSSNFQSQKINNFEQPIALPAAPQNYSTSYHTETHSSTGPIHSPGGQSFKSTEFSSRNYNKQESTTTTTTKTAPPHQPTFQTLNQPISTTTTYNYSQRDVPVQPPKSNFHQESFTSHTEKNSSNTSNVIQPPQPASYQYENYLSSRKEESRREETSRPVSQVSNYSESRNYKRNYEEKIETKTIPAAAPATNVTYKDLSNAQSVDDVFNKKTEMSENLPIGSISNTHNNTEGGYRDASGHDVSYKRETQTSADPGRETSLLKEEEKRVVETPLEPGVISRHVTTKYYKKKTVTDTTTTTE